MLRPSYNQLIKQANENFETEEPIVRSRYSIVLAAAKRARQLVDGNEPYVNIDICKPLSVAVAELNEGKVKILPEGYVEEEAVVENAQEAEEAAAEESQAEESVSEDVVSDDAVSEEAEEAFAAEVTEEIEI